MKYTYGDLRLSVDSQEFNKDSGKETLQYAVGGLLYMPASNKKIVKKIVSGEYAFVKSMVLDLEDSLGDDLVGYGQRTISAIISELDEAVKGGELEYSNVPLIFIRVRDFGQITDTVRALDNKLYLISGFNIPKFDKNNCDKYISEFKSALDRMQELYNGKYTLYMMPIIENKNTLYRQLRMENLLYMNDKLREIEGNVLNIRVGGADFCSVYGIRRGIEDDIYDIGVVRSVLNDIVNVFGKNYVVSGPVWEYFDNKENKEDTRWREGLVHELYADKLNGFLGKTSIHPSQLPVIQQSMIVKEEDYEDAMSILGMNTNTVGVKKSTGGCRMNEAKTHTNWAKKVIGLAKVYGVR